MAGAIAIMIQKGLGWIMKDSGFSNPHPFEDDPLAGSAAILCTGGPDVIRKEAWSFYRTSSGVRLCWELEEPREPRAKRPERDRVKRPERDREFFTDNLLVRINLIIEMVWWTGLAPWECSPPISLSLSALSLSRCSACRLVRKYEVEVSWFTDLKKSWVTFALSRRPQSDSLNLQD